MATIHTILTPFLSLFLSVAQGATLADLAVSFWVFLVWVCFGISSLICSFVFSFNYYNLLYLPYYTRTDLLAWNNNPSTLSRKVTHSWLDRTLTTSGALSNTIL